MSGYTVSARKYRPDTFETVVGQEHITDTLRNAIKQDHLAHSFLFTGPRGVGKTTCARILAKTINCQHITEAGEACNECESCRIFNENKSLNIYELDAASNNSVEDIRSLVEQVRFGPQGGKYKVYIIDEVHMLSQSAFNAFLKTLEEPPPYAIFILATTEKHRILPTILSRCQIFDFNRIQVTDIYESLKGVAAREGIEAEPEALHIIAQKADGALRDALSLYDRVISFAGKQLTYRAVIDNLNILDYDYFFKATDYLIHKDLPNTLLTFNDVLNQGFDGHNYLNGLSEHMRNLLVCKDPKTLPLLELTEQMQQRYQQQAQQVSGSFLLSALNILNHYDLNYKASRNQRLHTEIALMKLAHLNDALSLPEVQAQQEAAPQPDASGEAKKKVAGEEPDPSPAPATEQAPPGPAPANGQSAEANGAPASDALPAQAATQAPPAQSTASRSSPKLGDLSAIRSRLKEEEAASVSADEEAEEKAPDQEPAVTVTQKQVEELWHHFLENGLKEKQFLYNNLIDKHVTLQEDYTVTFKVESKAVKMEFEREKSTLIEYIQSYFGATPIGFYPVVEPPTQEQKRSYLVNAKDKYEAMLEKNPKLKALQDRLGLRIDQ